MTDKTVEAVARALRDARVSDGDHLYGWRDFPADFGVRNALEKDMAQAAITAHLQALKEAGFVVVPVEVANE